MSDTFSARELYESGLLYEINRTLLHPYGIEMSVLVDEHTGDVEDQVFLRRVEDVEGVTFNTEQMLEGRDKLEAFYAQPHSQERGVARSRLGFFVQHDPVNDQP